MVRNETIMINIDTRYSEYSIKDTLNRGPTVFQTDIFPSEDLDSSQEYVAFCPLF